MILKLIQYEELWCGLALKWQRFVNQREDVFRKRGLPLDSQLQIGNIKSHHCSQKNDPTAVIWNLARLWWFKHTYMDTKSLKNVLKCRSFVIALFFVCLHYPPQRWFYFYLTWTSSIFLSLHPDLRQALGEASNSTICVKNSSEESNILWFLHFLLVFFLFIVIIMTLMSK